MELFAIIPQMRANAQRIRALVEGVSEVQARWKPDPETWSVLEVINHLYDEEREDFRVRLDLILHAPGAPGAEWPPIDPRGWVTARGYNQRDLGESLRGYLAEREDSLAFLAKLGSADWTKSETTPWGGSISAGDMLAALAGHDLLHLRQLVELQWAWSLQLSAPYSPAYAGDW